MKYFHLIWYILILFGCKKYDSPASKIDADFSLKISDTLNTRADGQSYLIVSLSNTKESREGFKVSFSSTKGSFLLNDVIFQNNIAITKLKVDQDSGIYVVKALLKEGDQTKLEKSIIFHLRSASPDSIGLELDRSLYSINNPMTIKTYLYRSIGSVTKGTRVFFRAYQIGAAANDTSEVGRFEGVFNNYSNIDGKLADIKFYPDTPGIDTLKAITIEAKTLKDNGEPLRKIVSIRRR